MIKKVFASLDSTYYQNMDWNRTLLTTGRCIDDPEWWRCIQMHWDAFVTAWREIWCRASSPWPLLRLPKLISTTPWIPNSAKTDIHSTEWFCRCQNLVAMHLITFVHMAWVLNFFTQRSHYILLYWKTFQGLQHIPIYVEYMPPIIVTWHQERLLVDLWKHSIHRESTLKLWIQLVDKQIIEHNYIRLLSPAEKIATGG